jgi:hypothetical protein
MGKKDKKSVAHKERIAQKVFSPGLLLKVDCIEGVEEGGEKQKAGKGRRRR